MRLLEAVIAGASRREAVDCFDVSASSVVKWLQRRQKTGSVAAKPTGGSISQLEEHADWLLALISKQSDLTLDEVVAAMRKRRIAGSRSAVWRLLKRYNISFKKNLRAAEQERADAARARRRWMREQGMFVLVEVSSMNTSRAGSRLSRTMLEANTQARRYRHHRQPSGPQRCCCGEGHQNCACAAALSSEILARSQSNRAGRLLVQ
jgi:transposase